MARNALIALRTTLVTLALLGLGYPMLVTGLGAALFPDRASGSFVRDEAGAIVGSTLIGQRFEDASYFHGRPSAAGDNGYDALKSGGSNLAVTSKKLRARVKADVERLRKENPEAKAPIPAELVTASASGLDPEISPEAAKWQIARIAKARGIVAERIHAVVTALSEGRTLGLLGEPRVNVLALNLALDRRFGRPKLPPKAAPTPPK